jgi:chemotaxis protein MotB
MLLKVGRMTFPYRPILVCAVTAAGCVTTGTYNRKVAELEKLRSDENQAAAERERSLQSQIAALTTDRDAVRRQLDEMTALADALRKRLEKLGQNVDKLTGEKGQLSQALSEANLRLAELRKQEAAAEARAATFRTLVEKFRSMIDSGQLKVVIRDGRMLIAMPNDVLFDTGKTDIKPDGRAALVQVAKVLITIPNRRFEVAGHTDNVPIRTARFPSNWELSTARAVEVTNFLIAQGLQPQVLAAAGYGEFDPVAPNDNAEHRAQNRRIEIVLRPNLSELPSLEVLQSHP